MDVVRFLVIFHVCIFLFPIFEILERNKQRYYSKYNNCYICQLYNCYIYQFRKLLYLCKKHKFKQRMYYQLIISILHSKRQKSDYVDSVQIRKGNNLTYLTFDYIKNYQIVFEQECFNRTQNVTNKSYQMIFQRGRGETTSIKGCDCHHLLLFYKNQQKCSLSYCFPTFYISRKADSNTDFWSLLSEMVKYILFIVSQI